MYSIFSLPSLKVLVTIWKKLCHNENENLKLYNISIDI